MAEGARAVQFRTILHATDFSESSNHALDYAVVLARQFQARLVIVHVVEPLATAFYFEASQMPPPVELLTNLEDHARKALGKLLPPEVESTLSVEYLIREGAPFLEILLCAKEIGADVIVCGTHGRAGFKHLIFGSVAENVVRKSVCPVLTVRHPKHTFEMPV